MYAVFAGPHLRDFIHYIRSPGNLAEDRITVVAGTVVQERIVGHINKKGSTRIRVGDFRMIWERG